MKAEIVTAALAGRDGTQLAATYAMLAGRDGAVETFFLTRVRTSGHTLLMVSGIHLKHHTRMRKCCLDRTYFVHAVRNPSQASRKDAQLLLERNGMLNIIGIFS